eukprot:gene4995-6630_t
MRIFLVPTARFTALRVNGELIRRACTGQLTTTSAWR